MATNEFIASIKAKVDEQQAQKEIKTTISKVSQKVQADISVKFNGQQIKDAAKVTTTYKDALGNTVKGVTTFNSKAEQLGKTVYTTTEKFKQGKSAIADFSATLGKVAKFAAVTAILGALTTAFEDAIQNVVEFDKALTDLNKVTDLTTEQMSQLKEDAYAAGVEVARTTTEMVQAATEFAKSGYSEDQIINLGKTASLYQNIADSEVSAADASGLIISQLKAFNMEADKSEHIVDVINEVSNNFAVSSSDIGDALSKTSSAMGTLGNSFEETVGLVTAGTEIMQGQASKVARGLRTIGNNIADAAQKSNTLEITVNGMTKSVALFDETTNDLKSTYQILDNIAQYWQEMSNAEQQALAIDLAGKNQFEVFTSVLGNFNQAQNATTAALNSSGSAMKENEKWVESLEGKTALLNAEWEKFTLSLNLDKFIKGLTDAGTAALKFINKCGGIEPLLYGISAALVVLILTQFPAIVTGLKGIGVALQALIIKLTATNTLLGGAPILIGVLVTACVAFTNATNGAAEAAKNLSEQTEEVNQVFNDSVAQESLNIKKAEDLATKITELDNKIGNLQLTEEEDISAKAQLKSYVEDLTTLYPEWNIQIDEQTGRIKNGTTAIWNQIEAQKQLMRANAATAAAQAASNQYTEAYAKQQKALMDWKAQHAIVVANTASDGQTLTSEAGSIAFQKQEQAYQDLMAANAELATAEQLETEMLNMAKGYTAKYENLLGKKKDGNGGGGGGSGGDGTSTATAQKEAYSLARAKIERDKAAGLLTEAEFIDKLEEINNQYYRDYAELEEEFVDNETEIYERRTELAEDEAKAKEKALEEEKKAAKEALKVEKERLTVIKEQRDAEVELLELYAKQKQDDLDALIEKEEKELELLEDTNEAREEAIELSELEDALAQAKSTKVKVWRDGKWQYESDATAVAKAQQELSEYKQQQEVESTKKKVQAKIDAYEAEKQAWADVVDNYEDESDRLLLEEQSGLKLEELIYDKRIDKIEEFAKAYEDALTKARDAQTALNEATEAYENADEEEDDDDDIISSGRKSTSRITEAAKSGDTSGLSSTLSDEEKSMGYKVSEKEAAEKIRELGLLDGYASGTVSASGGLHLVGEQGAELRVLNQGDGIVPASITRNLMDIGRYSLSQWVNKIGAAAQSGSSVFNIANLSLPSVHDANDFINELMNFSNKAIQSGSSRT